MNRRGFLKRGAMAVLGAAAVVAMPSLAKSEPSPAFNSYASEPLATPLFYDSEGCPYFGPTLSIDAINRVLPKLIAQGSNSTLAQSRFLREVTKAQYV